MWLGIRLLHEEMGSPQDPASACASLWAIIFALRECVLHSTIIDQFSYQAGSNWGQKVDGEDSAQLRHGKQNIIHEAFTLLQLAAARPAPRVAAESMTIFTL